MHTSIQYIYTSTYWQRWTASQDAQAKLSPLEGAARNCFVGTTMAIRIVHWKPEKNSHWRRKD